MREKVKVRRRRRRKRKRKRKKKKKWRRRKRRGVNKRHTYPNLYNDKILEVYSYCNICTI
jgi:hypothetical protein